ncbi:MAG TPA: Hsp70 family protein [Pirellulales bacterium]|nr:Hsp70 family protein [Pirellulales bacterium]
MSPPDNHETLSRYLVGIDLGTTNSAVAYVDTLESPPRVHTLPLPQLVAPAEVEARETLPSFHYEAAAGEFAAGALALPWSERDRNYAVGFFARDHGTSVPGRLIASAKSWLCHPGVDRTAQLLPWHGAPDVERLSPVEASARYLEHIRAAWDARFPQEPLAEQDVVLTLPASFDEVARELTVRAARLAGLPRVVLIEEPQAAFYAWIDAQGDRWQEQVTPGQKILVCDIGGGTSDFTLIRVRRGEAGKVMFHRVAVGEHLILGGDNLDLALAHHIERKLTGDGKLEPRQWAVLVRSCRRVKETLLGADAPEHLTVNLPGSGAKLIGGGLQVDVTRAEVEQLLLEGFLPRVALDDKPAARRSGFQEFGLPFAPDPAITKYLASFLSAHRQVALDGDAAVSGDHDPARPDLVLFNGGFFASPVLRGRLLEVLGSWFEGGSDQSSSDTPWRRQPWQPRILENARLDLAVAQGAAYYGLVRRGLGVRISAGLARTYYIGVEDAAGDRPSAVCLVPAGVEEGAEIDLSQRRFELAIRQPVEFPIYVSSTRLTDRPGDLLTVDPEQMTSLPPIRTVLEAGKKGPSGFISVELHARLTEIGTLDLWCGEADGPRTWRLQFDVRAATETDRAAHRGSGETEGVLDEAVIQACRRVICGIFLPDGPPPAPASLVKRLEETTELKRRDWPMTLLRGFWETLINIEAGRRRTAEHELRWLYLLGFSLRPGYGLAVDDWRVAQTWKLLQGKRIHHTPACRTEWLILWRRIAGGLNAGQQRALAEPLLAALRPSNRPKMRKPDLGSTSHEAAEAWRLLGSLELLPVPVKVELGDLLLPLAEREKVGAVRDAAVWALGRLGARVPMYGPLNTVTPADAAARWLEWLIDAGLPEEAVAFSIVQLARRTEDRYRDLSDKLRERAIAWLERRDAPAHYRELVAVGGALEESEAGLMFGESLPRGLRLGS